MADQVMENWHMEKLNKMLLPGPRKGWKKEIEVSHIHRAQDFQCKKSSIQLFNNTSFQAGMYNGE